MGSKVKLRFGVLLITLVIANTNPLVETSLGIIKGTTLKTEKGRDISAFRGIRYAKAPIGNRRFKAPVPVTKWLGELDATKDGPFCPQPDASESLISEDCLILNVYTQNLTADRPVIVFIHGGSNCVFGSHSVLETSPHFLMDSDVVLVTINYRLGALGFVSTGTVDAPGNYAYLDQIMALQWVHEHIQRFGGNPNAVTLMGQSAGARAVSLHMTSPLSRDLFHGAIIMSSSISNHEHINNVGYTRFLARQSACPMYNPEDVLSCLRNVSLQRILQIADTLEPDKNFPRSEWKYEIDGHFLHEDPILSFAEGRFHRVPILTGVTRNERDFKFDRKEGDHGFLHDFNENFDKYGPDFLLYSPQLDKEMSNKLKEFYLGNKSIEEQPLENLGKIYSDSKDNHGVHMLVELARHFVDVYLYRFDYTGRFSNWRFKDGRPKGTCHSDDLQYIFKYSSRYPPIGSSDPEWFMVERMVGLISAFAYNGSPGSVGNVEWLPCNKTVSCALYNDVETRMGPEPNLDRMKLWDELYPVTRKQTVGIPEE